MALNLRDRLKHIRQSEKKPPAQSGGIIALEGWMDAGFMNLKREIVCDGGILFPEKVPESAVAIIKGIKPCMAYEDMVFFDLETSGLSTGSGTNAFLAAFGRLVFNSRCRSNSVVYNLHITQYLLLDYNGEGNFLENMLSEIKPNSIIVSYNGKSFDSQIFKSRCIVNGIKPPDFCHLDLLYPARVLWKKLLGGCSQKAVETGILGIDRKGDVSGAMAPEIWFSFLKTGVTDHLLLICDHNKRDISGLASIFSAILNISADPINACKKINFDIETLSIRLGDINFLHYAAEKEFPWAILQYALLAMRTGNFNEGREWYKKAASLDGVKDIQITALRFLAIDSEWRQKDAQGALEWTKKAMYLLPSNLPKRKDFERRLERLERKCSQEDKTGKP